MEVDGYGNPFPLELQQRHWEFVKASLEQYDREQRLPKPPTSEPGWKDKPAGYRSLEGKGTGV